MSVTIRRVQNRFERRKFLLFPWRIYAEDPYWVPPLIPDRRKTVSKKRGIFFEQGAVELFSAYRDGVLAGTICAAHDPPKNENRARKEGIFGFFECINDYDVAKALFDKASEWTASRGLDALCGPFNLNYENAYGVLIEARDRAPTLMCGHSPPYYQAFLEKYGFEKYRGDNLAFYAEVNPESDGQKRLDRLATLVKKRSKISIRTVELADWDNEIDRIHHLLVKSLAHLEGAVPWRRDVLEDFLMPFRRLADPQLILFAEAEGEAIGWFPGIKNLNELFIRVNGLRYPWNYYTLYRGLKATTECLTVKSLLVLPEYWNRGAGILLFDELAKRAYARGFKWIDLSLTGEDNPQTPFIAEKLGAHIYKRYRTYIKDV